MADPPASPFLSLPAELIHQVLTYLPLSDLLSISRVNRILHEHSQSDLLYEALVKQNVPGHDFPKPKHSTWQELYRTHHPYWFIPRRKIWFSDSPHTGKLIVARYNHRINAIEGYALVAERPQPTAMTWQSNPDTFILSFEPKVQLDLNVPVIRLDASAYENAMDGPGHRLRKEVPMDIQDSGSMGSTGGLASRIMLTRRWPAHLCTKATPLWPPLTIPAHERARSDSASAFRDVNQRPSTMEELSTSTFRMRKFLQFRQRLLDLIQPSTHAGVSVRVGAEDVSHWATLPEECYTSTPEKPWQGIWCGDYSGHGCEFILVTQPDRPQPLPLRAAQTMEEREASTDFTPAPSEHDSAIGESPGTADDLEDSVAHLQTAAYEREVAARSEAPEDADGIYHGRIEAIKLTGDANIPRGEYTFIAPDIGPDGYLRTEREGIFKGARIVKSVGHIAAHGFRDHDYIPSQLILISKDRLGHYWEEFGHVSFYRRVNVEEFLKVP